MKKFKYKIEYFSGYYSGLEGWLNDQGKKGWELVSVKYYSLCDKFASDAYVFKKEIQEDDK